MAATDTPIDDPKRENPTNASFPPVVQRLMNQQLGGSNSSQHSDSKSRGMKRSLDETYTRAASSVTGVWQQNSIFHASPTPVPFQPSEKYPNVFVDNVNNNHDQSMAKRPRLECAECLASHPNSGDCLSGGSITPSGPRHGRLSTGPVVASLQRQPDSSAIRALFSSFSPKKGDGGVPYCPTSAQPASQDTSSSRIVLPHRPSSEPASTLSLKSSILPMSNFQPQSRFLPPTFNNSWNADAAQSSSFPLSNAPSMNSSNQSFYLQQGHLTEGTLDIMLSLPTSTSRHKAYHDQLRWYRPQSETDVRNKAAQRQKEPMMMRRAADSAQAGRPFAEKRREIGVEPVDVPPRNLKDGKRYPNHSLMLPKEPASSSSMSLVPTDHKSDSSNVPPSFLSNPNSNPVSEPNSLLCVTSPLVNEQPNFGSNPTAVSHTLPTLPGNPSPSPIPEPESDLNVQVLDEMSNKAISTTPSASSLSAPDTSRQTPVGSAIADAVPPKLSFPELRLTPSESEGLSNVIEYHADSVLKLFEENLAYEQQKHAIEMARLQSDHEEELTTLREVYSKQADMGGRLLAAVNHENKGMIVVANRIQNTFERLREKLEKSNSKSKELQERFKRKLAEQKEAQEQQKKDSGMQIATLRGEWLTEKQRLEESIQNEKRMRRSESEARKMLVNEKVAFQQRIAKLNEDRLNCEAIQQKLEIWAKQMQVALEKQAEDHQQMMQKANLVWEERVKASRQTGTQKGEATGFELGKAEAMDRVKELTEALSEAEKARVREKETWDAEKEKIAEDKRALEQQSFIDSKKIQELTQQAIKRLDQHWTKEIETRWANLMATEGKNRREEQARREAEDAVRTSEIERRDRQIVEMEGELKALRKELEDRRNMDMNNELIWGNVAGPGQFSRMNAKSMLEESLHRGADPTFPGDGLNQRPGDPCRIQ